MKEASSSLNELEDNLPLQSPEELDKEHSEDIKSKLNSQSGNTQIDLDDSASSDDFFGDIFEGFMSDDEDDAVNNKQTDNTSHQTIAPISLPAFSLSVS